MKYLFFIFLLVMAASVFAPQNVLAQTCPTGRTCLYNPLKSLNIQRPAELVTKAFAGFAAIVGIVAIAFTVFNGFKLIIASNEESITKAKEGLKWSVGGFVVAILSFTVVSGSAKLLGFNPSLAPIGEDKIKNPITGPERPNDFVSVLVFIMQNFLGLIGFVTILMIVYYGYRYITAAGNEEALEQAKTGLKWAIIGFVITILAYTIVSSVQRFLLEGPPA